MTFWSGWQVLSSIVRLAALTYWAFHTRTLLFDRNAMARNKRKIKKANHGKRPCCGNLSRKRKNKFKN